MCNWFRTVRIFISVFHLHLCLYSLLSYIEWNSLMCRVQAELKDASQTMAQQIETIEQASIHRYYAEPLPDMPRVSPNCTLSQKAGYLFIRTYVPLIVFMLHNCKSPNVWHRGPSWNVTNYVCMYLLFCSSTWNVKVRNSWKCCHDLKAYLAELQLWRQPQQLYKSQY